MTTDTLQNQRDQAIGTSYGDVAQQRRGTADQLRQIAEKIAAGDVDSAMRLVQQIIAVEATAADQNFRAQLQLETVQGSIGNMLKIFGTMIKAFGGEELGQQLIDMADDPNLRLDRVNPDTSRLEGLDTNMDPSLRGHTRGIITQGGEAAREQASNTGQDVDGQVQETNRNNGLLNDESPDTESDGSPAVQRTVSFTRDEMTRALGETQAADRTFGGTQGRIVGTAFRRHAGEDGVINSQQELERFGAEIRTSALTPAQQRLFMTKAEELALTL